MYTESILIGVGVRMYKCVPPYSLLRTCDSKKKNVENIRIVETDFLYSIFAYDKKIVRTKIIW